MFIILVVLRFLSSNFAISCNTLLSKQFSVLALLLPPIALQMACDILNLVLAKVVRLSIRQQPAISLQVFPVNGAHAD